MSVFNEENIELRWDKYIAHLEVPAELLDNTKAKVYGSEALLNVYLLRVQTDILCDDLEPEEVEAIETVLFWFPATTWQMFKKNNAERWFMRWFIKRWPIRMHGERKTVTLNATIRRRDIYPSAKYVKELGQSYRKIEIARKITNRDED